METLKITITKKTETKEDIEIQIPYYSKNQNNNRFWKVFGTGAWDCIVVGYPAENCCEIHNTTASNGINDNIQCEQSEFDNAFETAMNYLNNLNSKK